MSSLRCKWSRVDEVLIPTFKIALKTYIHCQDILGQDPDISQNPHAMNLYNLSI